MAWVQGSGVLSNGNYSGFGDGWDEIGVVL